MADSVNAGADELKRANFGSKLGQWRAMHESGCNVATLGQPIQKSTGCNVATSPRRDVSTSRRCNVAMSARDMLSIIKSTKGSEIEAWGGVRTRARKSRAAATLTSKKCP